MNTALTASRAIHPELVPFLDTTISDLTLPIWGSFVPSELRLSAKSLLPLAMDDELMRTRLDRRDCPTPPNTDSFIRGSFGNKIPSSTIYPVSVPSSIIAGSAGRSKPSNWFRGWGDLRKLFWEPAFYPTTESFAFDVLGDELVKSDCDAIEDNAVDLNYIFTLFDDHDIMFSLQDAKFNALVTFAQYFDGDRSYLDHFYGAAQLTASIRQHAGPLWLTLAYLHSEQSWDFDIIDWLESEVDFDRPVTETLEWILHVAAPFYEEGIYTRRTIAQSIRLDIDKTLLTHL